MSRPQIRPTILGYPLLPVGGVGNGLRGFLEDQLSQPNTEDAEDGDTGKQRIHGRDGSGLTVVPDADQ